MNEELETNTFFVPGNHDVWRKDKSSIDSLFNLNASKYALTDKVVEINDEWTVVGAFPWYDYILETEGMPKDRKSTRLNSSHVAISYAVFCLKKKKKEETTQRR